MKIPRVSTWKDRPATIMLSPTVGDLFWWEAEEARPPPAAWRRRDMTSQGMNWWWLVMNMMIRLRSSDSEFS